MSERKEKWVKLFEQVTGRQPSPQEFLAGKEGGFDFKSIRQIAGLDAPANLASHQVLEEVPLASPPMPTTVETPTVAVPPVDPLQVPGVVYPMPVKSPLTKKEKMKRLGWGAGLLLLAGLGFAYYHFDQVTGPEVATDQFVQAVDSNDFDQVAQLLSTKENKWTKEETKGFLAYLEANDVNIEAELEKLAESSGKTIYNDERGNKLLGLVETGKKFGIFPEYRVATYPIDLVVTSDLADLRVDGKAIPVNKETSLGEANFAPKSLPVKAKTELGDLDTSIGLDLQTVENNRAMLRLVTSPKLITATLPSDLSGFEKIKLVINGKEVADSLSKELDFLDYQEVEVYAKFTYAGNDYTTSKETVILSKDKETLIPLGLSEQVKKQIDEAKKAKEAQEKAARDAREAEKEQERQLAATKDRAYNFITSYRQAVYSSIRNRDNTYAKYYDTNTDAYRGMADYTTNGGADRANVSHLQPGDYSMTDFVQKDNTTYELTVHNTFTEVYRNGRSDFVEKYQTFTLRAEGDEFKIINISENKIR